MGEFCAGGGFQDYYKGENKCKRGEKRVWQWAVFAEEMC